MLDIITDNAGNFQDIAYKDDGITGLLSRTGTRNFRTPVLFAGADRGDDILSIRAVKNHKPAPLYFPSTDLVPFARSVLGDYAEVREWLEYVESRTLNKVRTLLHRVLNDQQGSLFSRTYPAEAVLKAYSEDLSRPNHQHLYASMFSSLASIIWTLCDQNIIVSQWSQSRDPGFAPLVTAIWLQHARAYPLLISASDGSKFRSLDWKVVNAPQIAPQSLLDETERTFGLPRKDIDNVFRVWSMARGQLRARPGKTDLVGLAAAREFCRVLSESQREQIEAQRQPHQAPAPATFEYSAGFIDLTKGARSTDSAMITSAAARTLGVLCDDLIGGGSFHNTLPELPEALERIKGLLYVIERGAHDDGLVISVGLELNALQWKVDAVHSMLADATLGQFTALAANAHIFLGRFPIWVDFVGSAPASGSSAESYAGFDLSKRLLADARERSHVLSQEAESRVDGILRLADRSAEQPILKEGVVRSGENLAAAVVSGIGRTAEREAKGFGGTLKTETYRAASRGIIDFARDNVSTVLELGRVRHWPWAQWAETLLRSLD